MSRQPSSGTPGAACQEGLGWTVEGPPPVAEASFRRPTLSFQLCSGMQSLAEEPSREVHQRHRPEVPPANLVPPTARLPGQPAAPLSPDATTTVMPWAAAWVHRFR